jgi:hypothetical protein
MDSRDAPRRDEKKNRAGDHCFLGKELDLLIDLSMRDMAILQQLSARARCFS